MGTHFEMCFGVPGAAFRQNWAKNLVCVCVAVWLCGCVAVWLCVCGCVCVCVCVSLCLSPVAVAASNPSGEITRIESPGWNRPDRNPRAKSLGSNRPDGSARIESLSPHAFS
jgi:hypothetical protein